MSNEVTPPSGIELESGTYELIKSRLRQQGETLRSKLNTLNQDRKSVFGALDMALMANDRITTQNNCIPADMVALGNHFIFAYNVHLGLRSSVKLSDVFSMYRYDPADHGFHSEENHVLEDPRFTEDFQNLYKYYKDTVFSKFAKIGPHLFMVFRVGKGTGDIKTFKWALEEENLIYLGNRFDHEFRFPDQHQFVWQRTSRDMQRPGKHPHISILDRVFVETIGGDLTIKVEDNTESGKGIYEEAVDRVDQTLDDAEFFFADLENLIVLKIRPYQEKKYRYIIFNDRMQQALRVDALEHACVLLPDDQGLIFSNGYYLQTGDYKIFDSSLPGMHFEKRIVSPNGEDFLYVFYQSDTGTYALLPYNLVNQQVETPILCNGFSLFPNGELCYFRAEENPGKYHVVQVWKTPFTENEVKVAEEQQNYLSKIGNKDLVRGMAECQEILNLMAKGETFGDLYLELVRKSTQILDAYYWIRHQETQNLGEVLEELRDTASTAIEEYEKVRSIRANTQEQTDEVEAAVKSLLGRLRRKKPDVLQEYVDALSHLRKLRGEVIQLRSLRYHKTELIDQMEADLVEGNDRFSQDCVDFLLEPSSLEPYLEQVGKKQEEIDKLEKVVDANKTEDSINQISTDLELLIDVVGTLKIEDATETTRIIDNISSIYAQLNQVRASLVKKRKSLLRTESQAEFQAQIKLLDQAVLNYLDVCDTPDKTESYLTKLMVQLEELEGKFSEFDEFILLITEKREEVYQAFESRKVQLVDARNRRSQSLSTAADRILKGIQSRSLKLDEEAEIQSYFASDPMIEKVRDLIDQLNQIDDSVKADEIQTRLKSLQEDALRQLKDKSDLFVDGANIIKFGSYQFSVNTLNLDLTIVPRNEDMYFHLTGTNFFEKIQDQNFEETRPVWSQILPSENKEVYRAEYLAYKMLQNGLDEEVEILTEEQLLTEVQSYMAPKYDEGYVKGVHDYDTSRILFQLLQMEKHLGLLRFSPDQRACVQVWWTGFLDEETRSLYKRQLKGAGLIIKAFPSTREFDSLKNSLASTLQEFIENYGLCKEDNFLKLAEYAFLQLSLSESFIISEQAAQLHEAFLKHLKLKRLKTVFDKSIKDLADSPSATYELIRHWVAAFAEQEDFPQRYQNEVAAIFFANSFNSELIQTGNPEVEIEDMRGDHDRIVEGIYYLDYLEFIPRLKAFEEQTLPMYQAYLSSKHQLTVDYKEELKLESFRPRVLTSFVRNKLIDQLYLPLLGANLAKQIGTTGSQTRTDRMGMLLLISPPGYGKTTLMEYVASKLGLIFVKVNGPSIGHQVTSLDPVEAPNAAAREELNKLNLSLEMGDNIMIYLDDIQHCNPEFLQKFISLCDAQRKIEGVFKGQTRTYDLRGRKVAVVMAGNPYTESGEKFRIPDMLSNRADTYNLGDIIGDSADLFKLSYVENALTANPTLSRMAILPKKDIYQIIDIAEGRNAENIQFESHVAPEDLKEFVAVLKNMLRIRDVVLNVNQAYIYSAAQADAYRTEPPFFLQGSYRNMNKMAERLVPIMNERELESLILSHYESESQTLTNHAEANFLKFKMMNEMATKEDEDRWNNILEIYRREKAISADRLGQLVQEMGSFSDGLISIKQVLERGLGNSTEG